MKKQFLSLLLASAMTLLLSQGLPSADGGMATVIAQAAEAKTVTPVQITSVKKSGSSSLKIKWSNAGDVSYKLYRSLHENYGYKCIKTIKKSDKKTLSYTNKVKKGTQYFYRLVTIKGGVKSEPSDSVCGFLATGGKKKTVKTNIALKNNEYSVGLYEQDGKIKEVFRIKDEINKKYSLKIRTYDDDMNVISTKTIKLSEFAFDDFQFGGFYHAQNGCNYVLIGRWRKKSDKNRTYVKLIKYSKSWKKQKVLNLKFTDKTYESITPFIEGYAEMAEYDGKLYIYFFVTQAKGYKGGTLVTNTNISYEINLDTMKLTKSALNDTYGSYTEQAAVYKDNTLYRSNYQYFNPEGVNVSATDRKNSKNSFEVYKKFPFELTSYNDDMNPSLGMGGISVGQKNIITVGAVEKKDNVKNAYIILTDRKTGKSKLKWLTKYDKKKTNKSVRTTCIKKVTDNCFAVFYKVNGHSYCKYIDNNGKVLKTRDYKSLYFNKNMIIHNGYFVYTKEYAIGEKVYLYTKDGQKIGPFKRYDYKLQTFKIPVYVKQ